MFCFVNLLIIALVIPLYLFSNPNTTTAFQILTGNLVVQLVDKSNQKISTLFKTDKLRENRSFNITKGSPELKQINQLWGSYPDLNRFFDFQFHKVTMIKYSDTFLDFTPKILDDLSNYFKEGSQAKIFFNMSFTVKSTKINIFRPETKNTLQVRTQDTTRWIKTELTK